MADRGFALFDTAIGRCALAWGKAGLIGVQLPEANDALAERRLARRFPGAVQTAPGEAVAAAIARITAFLAGATGDAFTGLALDESGIGAFERGVYRETRAIPAGRTSTYGAIATALGDIRDSRRVGQALGRNPWPIIIPCHRVTGAGGWMGGFSAPGGQSTKLRLLELEGALAAETLPLFAPPAPSS